MQSHPRPDDADWVPESLEVFTNKADGYKMVKIPGGSFMMGSPNSEMGRKNHENPQHQVQVPAFFMGCYPITNAQYQLFLEANPKSPKPKFWADRNYNRPQQPVVGVSWEDAQAYAHWPGLRLPSEAEWEYACRAGITTRFYTGGSVKDLDRAGWYDNNSGSRLHPVGKKSPNPFGLYDMHGNVWEWVEDDWHANYFGAPEDGSAWIDGPRGDRRVVRGGSWKYDAWFCRSVSRVNFRPGYRHGSLGFRLAMSIAADS